MKRLKTMRRTTAMMLAAAMVCATAAFATSYESDYADVTAGSKAYQVQSILYQDSTRTFRASTWVETKDSSKVPANYIGVKAELMSDDTGDAIATTAWKYNSTTDYFMYAVTPKTTTSDLVYSRGQYKLYTGTTHKTGYAPETTYVGSSRMIPKNILSTLNADGTYPKTAAGLTYGSARLAEVVGMEPDLIAARGSDGTRGYVKNVDLNPNICCDTDYQKYLAELDANDWKIPLYDLQGAVIGTFEISKSEEIIPNADNPEIVKAALEAESNGQIHISASKAKLIAEGLVNGDYTKNASGQTYGSTALAPIVGHEPDLIAVRGINNTRGYVKNEDLNPEINTAADYQRYLAELDANDWKIPLYDQEGNVIGAFEISKSEEIVPQAKSPAIVKSALAA